MAVRLPRPAYQAIAVSGPLAAGDAGPASLGHWPRAVSFARLTIWCGIGSGIVMTLAADVSPAVGRPTFLGIWRELAGARRSGQAGQAGQRAADGAAE